MWCSTCCSGCASRAAPCSWWNRTPPAVLQLADRGYLLRTGNIVATGTGADLAADNSLFDSFIGLEAHGREA